MNSRPIPPKQCSLSTAMVSYALVMVFTFCTSGVCAQPVHVKSSSPELLTLQSGFNLWAPVKAQEYLFNKWVPGYLYYSSGAPKAYDSLNFNRFTGQVEVVVANKLLELGPAALQAALLQHKDNQGVVLVKATLGNQQLFTVVESTGHYLLASYLIANTAPKISQYKIDELRFEPKGKEPVETSKHYLIYKDNTWHPFKLSKGEIAKLFGISKKEVQQEASRVGIGLYNQQGLLKLFQFLN